MGYPDKEADRIDVNLEYYRVFYYVVKTGSFSQAAQELCISQPAVSQTIKQLERQLGGSLFLRLPRGIQLTREGEVLFSYVSQGYEYLMLAEKKVREMQNLETGEIRIGASDMTMEFYLLPHLERFHKQFPKVHIQVSNAPTPVTLQSLNAGKIDFGVVSEPVEPDKNLKTAAVGELQDIFVAGKDFFKGDLTDLPVTPKKLIEYPIIMLEAGTSTRKYVNWYFAEQGITLQPELELATSGLIVNLAARGMGIGCVVKGFAEPLLKSGELLEIPLEPPIPPRRMLIAVQGNLPLSAAGEIFLKMLDIQI